MEKQGRRNRPRTGYPRQRAVAACLTCREKKQKCDNLRPSCSGCQKIGMTCQYAKLDASSFDPASLEIIEQLSVIESLVRNIQISQSSNGGPSSSNQNQPWQSSIVPPTSTGRNGSSIDRGMISLNLDANFKAATDKMLQWPIFDKLLSSCQRFQFIDFYGAQAYTYLDDLLTQSGMSASQSPGGFRTESSRSIHISNEREDVEVLVDRFFKRVNNKNPILSRQVATRYCQKYYEDGPRFDLETCLVLLTCALGAVSMEYSQPNTMQSPATTARFSSSRPEDLRLGHCYFTAAEKRLGSAMTDGSTLGIQCLCLAGIYHMFTLRPMSALRMFQAAGSSLRILMSTGLNTSQETYQLYLSLFWTCSKSEREILAEIPISPPSLTGPGTPDTYPLPPQTEMINRDEWSVYEEDSWYFLLSEIALRRITDQVSEVVTEYIASILSPDESRDIQELIPVIAEFEHQVDAFREQLPHAIQFPDVPHQANTEWKQYTRGRYYRVLELMHRPFLFTALHDPNCGPAVRELAEKSLFNALRYLEHSHTSHRHHGTWLQLRNQLREMSLLLAASNVGGLAMPEGWEAGIAKSLAAFDYWLQEFPSCKTYKNVILTLAGDPWAEGRT